VFNFSWHVYNKDNVERVRKDEEKARDVEKKKEGQQLLAVRCWSLVVPRLMLMA
jgi:hypothetical protein